MYSFLEATSSKGSLSSKVLLQTLLCIVTMLVSARLWNRFKKWKRTTELINAFPGEPQYGILGNVFSMYYLAFNPAKDVLNHFRRNVEEYGPVLRFWVFHIPKICIADAEIAIKLFSNGCLRGKSSEVGDGAKTIGEMNLVTIPSEIHPHRRKQWAPSFTRKQIEKSVKFFRQQAIRLCGSLEEYAKTEEVFDFLEMSVECTFRTICYSAFGEEYMEKLPESVGRDHMHDLHTVGLNLTAKIFRPWIFSDFIYLNFTKEGRETRKCVRRGNLLTKQALHERQKHRQRELKRSQAEGENSASNSEDFECFMDHMVELMNCGQLTEKEVIQEMNAFIVTGYDTSGITICYVLYLLSLYPEHQELVVEELKTQVIPQEFWTSPNAYHIAPIDTKQMKYMELCIKETLRLFPVLPFSPRSTSREAKLPDGRIIPKGVDVYVLLQVIQRDPKYFPQPDEFQPERHLNPNPAFMPFSLGPRSCIGQVYAMYEMKVILAYLLMTYKWETTEGKGFTPIYQVLQVPENGMHFKITKR